MATQAGFDTRLFGPFGALFEGYLSAVDQFTQGKSPLTPGFDFQAVSQHMTAPLKAATRCQLETLGFMNRRAQAYMQVPTRLAQCRTPQDLVNEQMEFYRTAAEQYRETALKIGQAWQQAFPWMANAVPKVAERDYISFNGAGKDGGTHTTRQEAPRSQRRVA